MYSLLSFRGRTSTPNSQPQPSSEPGSVTTAPQELDEKILYQTADRNPTKAKEPYTDIKVDEMRGSRPNPGAGYDKQRVIAFKELEASNRQKDEKIKELEKQMLMAQRLLEIKATELSKAQAYTTKPDDFPGLDIIDMVKLLNSEIFNTATAISDMFEGSAKAASEEVVGKRVFLDEYREMAKKCIGERLYAYNCQIDESMALRQPVNPKDWIPLQLALQCVLVGWCLYVAGTIGPVPGDGEALQRCYEKIRVRGKSF